MDLSFLKWPVIIGAVVLVIWLMSSSGVNFMVGRYTAAPPGIDAAQDKRDEAGLTMVSRYLVHTFRYEQCAKVLQLSLDRYGAGGANYWNNLSRLSTCYEKTKQYQRAAQVIDLLIQNDAHRHDKRVPSTDALRLRVQKLRAVHELR